MALRRPQSICWACQCRQRVVGRRRWSTTASSRLEASALETPADNGTQWLGTVRLNSNGHRECSARNSGQSLGHGSAITKEFAEAMLSLEALYKTKDVRTAVLRSLSRPLSFENDRTHDIQPQPSTRRPHIVPTLVGPASPISHETFRCRVRSARGEKGIRAILRAQLLQVTTTRDLLRLVATVLHSREITFHLSANEDPIARAMYRCRIHDSDPKILRSLNAILWRFSHPDIDLASGRRLLTVGLKFAARARSLYYMKQYLKEYRARGWKMNSNVFRAIIAKFSIGHRGLGEIRNGRWRRSDLLQVLTGFTDCADLPLEQQYHLGTFVDRQDWKFLHKWVAALARCRQSETIWDEWLVWQESDAYRQPRLLEGFRMTSRTRGEYWFLEQMAMSGDARKAWHVLETSGIRFDTLKDRVTTRLLEYPEYASVWTDEMQKALLRKYDMELQRIERALGIEWQHGDTNSQGWHKTVKDEEEALEVLAADDWKDEEYPGFPYDDSPIMMPERERQLHDAEEEGLAS